MKTKPLTQQEGIMEETMEKALKVGTEILGWSIENPGQQRRHLVIAIDGRARSACGAATGGSVTPTLATNGSGATTHVCSQCAAIAKAEGR